MVKFLLAKLKSNFLIPIGLMLLYLLLPTANSGIDGYAYASAIKWGHEMVWPHHLLYVPFGRLFFLVMSFVQPLVLMKLLNALAAGISLFIFQRILKELQINCTHYFVLFVGACFGMMRYAAENETYILPLLCSLLGTLCFIKNIKLQKNSFLIFSGLWFGLGVLFHQIHGLWYLGFAIPLLANFNLKKAFVFMASGGVLVISVYILAYTTSKSATGIIKFVLHDVYAGQVNTSISLTNFIMTPISFIRTFIQVHGYMKPLLMANPLLLILPIAFLVIGFVSIKTLLKYSTKQASEFGVVSKAIFWSFILQFSFAFYSVGNAEFMVMLPVLIVLWVVLNFHIPTKPVFYISLMLLFWNIVFGLSPAHFLDLDGSKQLMAKMEKYPNAKWIVDEPQKIENMLDYYTGVNASNGKVIRPFINDTLQITLIKNLAKTELLTNCFNNGKHFGRQSLTITSHDFDDYNNFKHAEIDSVKYFGGTYFIEKLSVK
jgi:hypothetical protein